MKRPDVSVIVLTRDRPREFASLLEALSLLRMREFEVIVVGAEPRAVDHGADPELAERLTYLQCTDRNISKSRNLGLNHASGRIVAFIDDDAAPEPDWLGELIKPFERPEIGAVGGFVRGRNGVDYQWRGALVDRYGAHAELTSDDLRAMDLASPKGDYFLSTVGVNSAFDRDALWSIGGFDENFHYFLDESDVCIRLLNAGWRTAFAPTAEVHHAYSESHERASNRAPRDLFQIAASRAYFARTHGDPDWVDDHIERFRLDQVQRLKKFVQLGRLSRRQAQWIEARMDEGFVEGAARHGAGPRIGMSLNPAPTPSAGPRFAVYDRARRLRVALVATDIGRRRIYRAAERLATAGCEVSVLDFTVSARRLRVAFQNGVWRHAGGVLGRERINAPPPVPRRCVRVRKELDRVAERRALDVVIRPSATKYQIGEQASLRSPLLPRGFVAEPLRSGAAQMLLTLLAEPAKAPGASRSVAA